MANPQNLKPFVKGDKRINRNGRPRSFDALRKLAQRIGNENATDEMTRVELILRSWSLSKDPQLQLKFIEIAYGKVPNPIELTGKDNGAIKINVKIRHDEGD